MSTDTPTQDDARDSMEEIRLDNMIEALGSLQCEDDATRIAEIEADLAPGPYIPSDMLRLEQILALWMRDRSSAIYLLALLRARDGEIAPYREFYEATIAYEVAKEAAARASPYYDAYGHAYAWRVKAREEACDASRLALERLSRARAALAPRETP